MVTISQYICLSSFFVVARVYGGGSNSYVSKLSSDSLTSKGFSSSYSTRVASVQADFSNSVALRTDFGHILPLRM